MPRKENDKERKAEAFAAAQRTFPHVNWSPLVFQLDVEDGYLVTGEGDDKGEFLALWDGTAIAIYHKSREVKL